MNPRQWPLTSAQAARLIFGDEHYKTYVQWQSNIEDREQIHYYGKEWSLVRNAVLECPRGGLPTPVVYKTFMNWLRQRGDLYPPNAEPVTTLVIATSCRHPIHPGNNTQVIEACPVCVMRQCIEAMTRIWKVWEILGAPDRNFSVPEDEPMYFKVKALWRVEKQRWSNLVAKYEEMGECEVKWEDLGMQEGEYTFEELNSAQSCRAARQFAWKMNPVDLAGHDAVFEPHKPLTRKAGRPLVPDPSMLASPPFFPSTPYASPGSDAARLDEPSPMLLSTEQPASPPSSPLLSQQMSPPSSPRFPILELSEGEHSSSPEYAPSGAPRSSSLPASSPGTPVHRKKKVGFAEDVVDNEKRPLVCWYRGHQLYRRGRQACPSSEGWADSSFKNDEDFWEFGPHDDIELDGTDMNDFGLRAERTVLALEHDTDSDSDGDDDSDDSDASDTDPVTMINSEAESTPRRSSLLQLPFLLRAALRESKLNNDSDSEPDIHSDSDEYEDEGADEAMRLLMGDNAAAKASPHIPDSKMRRAISQVEQEPAAGDIGLQVLGRRDRSDFESDSLPHHDRGDAKRQRRGSM